MHLNASKLRILVPVMLAALAVIIGSTVASGVGPFQANVSGATISILTIPGGRFANLDGALTTGVPGSSVAITTTGAALPPGGGHALIYDYVNLDEGKQNAELVSYSAATSGTITITARALGGTSNVAHPADSYVKSATLLTAGFDAAFEGAITVADNGEFFCEPDATCDADGGPQNDQPPPTDTLMIDDELINCDWDTTTPDDSTTCTIVTGGRAQECYTDSATTAASHAVNAIVTVADVFQSAISRTNDSSGVLTARSSPYFTCQISPPTSIYYDGSTHPFLPGAMLQNDSGDPAYVGVGFALGLTGTYTPVTGTQVLTLGSCQLQVGSGDVLANLSAASSALVTVDHKSGTQASGSLELVQDEEVSGTNVLEVDFVTTGNPTTVTTVGSHGLTNGNTYQIIDTTANPNINGNRQITSTGASTFTVAVDTSSGSAGGAGVGWIFKNPGSECDTPPATLPLLSDEIDFTLNSTSDSDGDGASNWRELDARHTTVDGETCGRRDPWNAYDYYDTGNGGDILGVMAEPFVADGVIDLPNDILGTILNYTGNPGYAPTHTGVGAFPVEAAANTGFYRVAFDRDAATGPNHWNRHGTDGVIDLPNDILGVILQYTGNDGCDSGAGFDD